MNVVMRQDKYKDDLWKEHTGKTVQELGAEWKKVIERNSPVKLLE